MSVTTVPLRPVSKGGLWLLWIGLIALLGIGVAFALTHTPRIGFEVVKEGSGPSPTKADIVLIKYEGKLDDGTVFDSNEQAPLQVSQVVPGFADALTRMKKGGKYTLHIPAEKAYGPKEQKNPMTGEVVIPANADLTFEIDLIDYMSEADFQRRMQIQQMMQMQQQGGAPGGAPSLPEGAPLPQ